MWRLRPGVPSLMPMSWWARGLCVFDSYSEYMSIGAFGDCCIRIVGVSSSGFYRAGPVVDFMADWAFNPIIIIHGIAAMAAYWGHGESLDLGVHVVYMFVGGG